MSELAKAEQELLEVDNEEKINGTVVESAMALVVSGASFNDVARILNFKSGAHAKRAVERALASTVTLNEKDQLRKIATRRYEALLKSVMPRATDPKASNQLAYNQRAQSIIDRMVKMQGLDAPTQVQVTPTDEYLAEYGERLAQQLGLEVGIEHEPDIIEAEEINDDYFKGDQ